jgi:tetratricopeptide (TPR) repeat protein
MAEPGPDAPQELAQQRETPERDAPPDSDGTSGTQFDGEDFLFHLYRGSELLQDNCIEQAKEELERALSLQPRDVEGQGLLGVVYFRLGLYPRAIQIYEEICRACPADVTPRVNLALSYLKTGQPERSRDLLEEVTRRVPDHKRAWGYLGLCFERLGDYAKALASFERAEQPHLARRMQQRLEPPAESSRPESIPAEHVAVVQAPGEALQELDGVDEAEVLSRTASGDESAPTRVATPASVAPRRPTAPPPALPGRFGPAVPPLEAARTSEPAPGSAELITPSALAAAAAFSLEGLAARQLGERSALVRVEAELVLRLDALRALLPDVTPFSSAPCYRRQRGRDTTEPLGAFGAPLWRLSGTGAALLRAPPGRRVQLIALGGQTVYFREAVVLGFSGSARYESGRLATGSGEHAPMLMLAGTGIVVIEFGGAFRSVAVSAERSIALLVNDVAGWTGRLLPQPLSAEHAPGRGQNFVTFSGDGSVWLEGE